MTLKTDERDVSLWRLELFDLGFGKGLFVLCFKNPTSMEGKNAPMQSEALLASSSAQLGMTVAQWIPDAEFPAAADTHTHTQTLPQLQGLRHNPRLVQTSETDTMRKRDITSSGAHSPTDLTSSQPGRRFGYFYVCPGSVTSPAYGSYGGAQHVVPAAALAGLAAISSQPHVSADLQRCSAVVAVPG